MKKAQKIAIVFSVLVLLTFALWWHWERPLPLDRLIPRGNGSEWNWSKCFPIIWPEI